MAIFLPGISHYDSLCQQTSLLSRNTT